MSFPGNIRLSVLIISASSVIFSIYAAALFFITFSFPYLIVSVITYLIILPSVLLIVKKLHTEKIKLAGKITARLNPAGETHDMNDYEDKIGEINFIIGGLKSLTENQRVSGEVYDAVIELVNVYSRLRDELYLAKVNKVNRNEFLGNVAHELRTPIFAIQLALETLVDGAIHDEKVSMDFLGKALNQTVRMKELVDDLIHISKLETDMKLSRRYFPLNALVRETMHEMSDIISKKNISVVLNFLPDDDTRVFADSEKIKHVLINLIDNSVKYTPDGGTISITTEKEEREIRVSLSDTGVGIPKDDLPRIFERFYRVDKTRSRDMGGSGLGLSIVKHILELHNSRINVESETGKGSKFEFFLPC
ncbi:MAG: cell wall metabolism sensor histidine kinase WalK [Ignavibacteria bacterium]|nr:cell wall metabolism sensor histidine kinase WalK [Ignavibacteria bacterium]